MKMDEKQITEIVKSVLSNMNVEKGVSKFDIYFINRIFQILVSFQGTIVKYFTLVLLLQ